LVYALKAVSKGCGVLAVLFLDAALLALVGWDLLPWVPGGFLIWAWGKCVLVT
jgi:hypothetical protein